MGPGRTAGPAAAARSGGAGRESMATRRTRSTTPGEIAPMPDATSARPRVLAIGPYERDNVGDLLFLLVTERYLGGAEVIATAPFASDMTELLDRRVEAYGSRLRDDAVDAIWSMGGEIGGTTMESAFRMSMPQPLRQRFNSATHAEQQRMLAEAVDHAPLVAPYIPNPAAFERNAGAVTIVNSAGLGGLRGRPWHVRHELLEALRTADAVSVRDPIASAYLTDMAVEHTLVPDVVHALGAVDPHPYDADSDVVVVQSSVSILRDLGHEALAKALVTSKHLDGMTIRFVMAGTVPSTDSLEAYEQVADHIARLDPRRRVELRTERRPADIVEQLRTARVVIGTSLHVRIISAAYQVPRLTFTRVKPTRYAKHWDPHMPFDVGLADLEASIGRALEIGGRDEVIEASAELTRRADANARELADLVLAAPGRPAAEVEQLAARRRAVYEPILAERLACAPDEARLHARIDQATAEAAALRAELDEARRQLDDARARRPIARARRVAGRAKRRLRG